MVHCGGGYRSPVRVNRTAARDWGVSWSAPEPAYMQRGSHALATADGVWLVDPVDGEGLEEMIAPLGPVRGVLQLLDRHPRDGTAIAARHGAPLLAVPFAGVAGAPFEVVPVVRRRWWREVALWWPEHRALVVPEALGTAPYYLAPGAVVGVHPLLRMVPPTVLGGFAPLHLLPGHGPPVSGPDVADAVRAALARSRRDVPGVVRRMLAARGRLS